MPRTGHPETLIRNSDLTPEERKEKARKMGIASGVARRKKRTERQTAQFVLGLQPDLPEKTRNAILQMMGAEAENEDAPNILLISALAVAQRAMKGDIKALEKLLEMSGKADAKTKLEQDRLKLEKERLQFERERLTGFVDNTLPDTGFLEALADTAAEVNADGSDEPENADE